jgi:hypothetical protein
MGMPLVLLLLNSTPVGAQSALTLSGIVFEMGSGRTVEGAKVIVVGGKANSEVTDSEGSFVLTFNAEVMAGSTVRIRVEKQGYRLFDKLVPVSSTIPLRIPLQHVGPGHNKPSPEFKADVIQTIDHSVMSFWVAAERFRQVYPIDEFLNIRIISLVNVLRSFDSFGIEITTPSSPNWVPLTMIAVEGNYGVYGGPMNAAFLCRVDPPVWNRALKEEIRPGQTVRLSGFFQVPSSSGLRSGEMPSYRITLRDTVGRTHVIELQTPAKTKVGLNLEESTFSLTGEPIDLSQFKIIRP